MNTVKIKFEDFFNNVVCNNVERERGDLFVRFGYKYKYERLFDNIYTYSLKNFYSESYEGSYKLETEKDTLRAHIEHVVKVLQKDGRCVRVNPKPYCEPTKENETYYVVIF